MKATEQYFRMVLFIMLYKVVLSLEPVEEIRKCDHKISSAAISCGVIILYKAILSFEPVDEILKCDHKISSAVISCGVVCGLRFQSKRIKSVNLLFFCLNFRDNQFM